MTSDTISIKYITDPSHRIADIYIKQKNFIVQLKQKNTKKLFACYIKAVSFRTAT